MGVTVGETTAEGDVLGVGPGSGVHPVTVSPTTSSAPTSPRRRQLGVLPTLCDGKSPTEPVQRVDPRDGVVPLLTRMRATYRDTDISVSRSTEPVHSPPAGPSVPGAAGQQSGDEHRLADPGGEVDGVEHG